MKKINLDGPKLFVLFENGTGHIVFTIGYKMMAHFNLTERKESFSIRTWDSGFGPLVWFKRETT